ncbi:MAG: hypothetical protein V3V49_03320 [Candidatus Krumholzibacteria bacterium]
MTRRAPLVAFLIAAIAGLLFPAPGLAQYPFGKNKVNYSKKDWKVMQTDHVDIYYYPNEHNLVAFVAPIVEGTFLEYSEIFNLEFRDRLPLVFYSSHYDFQQTNIVPSLISEYTGGFTDLIKGRIAIPMTGSLWELRHVIRHEMVHAFMLEKLAVVMSDKNRFNYTNPPLWFVEGMAEYIAAREADTRSHMFVRDALIHGHLLDLVNIWRIEGSFMMYKEGEAVIRYIGNNFGVEAIIKILENWWMSDKFPLVLKSTIGLDLRELNDAFMKSIKRRYYPAILHTTFAPDAGKQLTPPHSFHSRCAIGLGSDGEINLYALGAQDGVLNLFKLERGKQGELKRKTLVEGARSSAFETIPAFRSKLEAHGDQLLFVAKRQERDAIYLWDTVRNKEIEHFTFPGLSVISSPTMSNEGTKIVFSAIDSTGSMDLFLYRRDSGRLERLTLDRYAEEDPDFHPTENLVIFSSDRCESGDRKRQGIYMVDVDSKEVTALTCGSHSDAHPDWSPDGKTFLFTSDRDGVFNIYLYDVEDRLVIRQTAVIGGVTTPVFMPDRSGFVASGYYQGEYHLFEFPLKNRSAAGDVMAASIDTTTSTWMSSQPTRVTYTTQDYKQKLGLDFAGTGLSVDPDFGTLGNGGAVVFSDILGNHQYQVFFGTTSNSQQEGNFFKRLNFGFNYANLTRRLNYTVGVFSLTSLTGDFFTVFRSERRFGIATGVSYPFSKFTRVDGSFVLRFVDRESDFTALANQKSFLGSTFLTYVSDNTLWTVGGPLKGWRYHTTIGQTIDFRGRGFDNTTVHFDIRKYFKLARGVVFAQRFVTRHSFGSDFQIFYLGGPWDLRGYDFREFFGRSTYLLNSEIRFPLINHFALSLPIGAIEFPLIRGALFFDAGKVSRFIDDTDWLGTIGVGTELNLGFAPVIRVNFTRATDFSSISSNTDFELFIGLNY